jgi:flagellin
VASASVQNALSKTQNSLARSFTRLSSGFRINGAADDAAGLGISKGIIAQARSIVIAERNASDGVSMAQTADGAADQMHNVLTRMRELAVAGANGALNSLDSANIETEFSQALAEVTRIAEVTTFNGRFLLNGTAAAISFQVGINTTSSDQITISFGGASASSLGIATTSVSDNATALSAIPLIDTAIQTLSTLRENWGSAINRFDFTVVNLQSQHQNLTAALSRLQDADIAAETAELSRSQVMSQAGAAVLAQANQAPQLALSLLRS